MLFLLLEKKDDMMVDLVGGLFVGIFGLIMMFGRIGCGCGLLVFGGLMEVVFISQR